MVEVFNLSVAKLVFFGGLNIVDELNGGVQG